MRLVGIAGDGASGEGTTQAPGINGNSSDELCVILHNLMLDVWMVIM